ncbi:MAG: TetR/AcrR family transcriptional regulator [Cytophagales bacterium]|nr:TetR/AcrR family transcriptional regulator [Cytophagales bacterium]
MNEIQDNKHHILATAFKLFFQKGYKEVTMSELVKESGLSKGAFYHYFSSKEELYNHSMEMFMSHYLSNFSIDYDESQTLRNNLKRLYNQFSPITDQMNTSTQEAAEALSNYLIFLQNLMRKEAWRTKMEVYNRNFTDEFTRWIKLAQTRGEIMKALDPLLLAKHFTSLMKGVGVLHTFVDSSEPVQVTFGKLVDQFFDVIEIKD